MALRQVILSRKIEDIRKKLEEIRAKGAAFLLRREEMKKRDDELAAALDEVTEQTPQEDRDALQGEIDEHLEAQNTLDSEIGENDTEEKRLADELKKLEDELIEIDERAKPAPEDRKDDGKMENTETRARGKFGEVMAQHIRTDEVKNFLTRVRELKGQTRAVTGTELTIPTVMLEILRDNMNRYSKLLSYVTVKRLGGVGRMNIAGVVPEGIWTEMYASLNELEFQYSQIEVDGYKVGGFIPIHNAILEDSDLNLASEIMDMLGQALGFALDKAILYGKGVKMPIGIVTRLAQTAKPSDWNEKAPQWTDLHTSHLMKINPSAFDTDEKFFAALMLYTCVARSNYSNGSKFWAMNETTWNDLVSRTIKFNAAGALVASQNKTMPIVGGSVVTLDFIPDGDIIGGYGSLYLLSERAGAQIEESKHVRFLDDDTVFKGTARYDGKPVFGEAFVVINIKNAEPTKAIEFAPDNANIVTPPIALPASGNYTGAVDVYLYTPTPNAEIYYTTDGSEPTLKSAKYKAPLKVTATTTIKAITAKDGSKNSPVTEAKYTIA